MVLGVSAFGLGQTQIVVCGCGERYEKRLLCGVLICDMGGAVKMESVLKKTLKSLCCSNGWTYGVFWRFDERNSMLLTSEDAYYDEQMGVVIDSMLSKVHTLREGIIGQVAFTGKHCWVFSDAQSGEWNSLCSIDGEDISQDDSEIHRQFSSGIIKTIAVIPVEPRGVVQFGSNQKIVERLEFLDLTKRLFREMENIDGLMVLSNAPSALNSEIYDPSGFFSSLISSGSSNLGNIKSEHGNGHKELIEKASASTNLTQSSSFTPEMQHERITSMISSTSHLRNQLQTAGLEAQFMLSDQPNSQIQQMFLQSASSVNNPAARTPCISTWSSEGSTLTSLERQLSSEMRAQVSQNAVPGKPNTVALWGNLVQDSQVDSMFTSLESTERLIDEEKDFQCRLGKSVNNQYAAPFIHATEGKLLEQSTSILTLPEECKPVDFKTDPSKSYSVDNLSQWFGPPREQSIKGMASMLTNDQSQSVGITSLSSGLDRSDFLVDFPVKHPASSMQSSVINMFSSDGKERSLNVPSTENDLFDGLGLDFGFELAGETFEDFIMPLFNDGQSTLSTGVSECISELDVGSMAVPRKGLFSELGLDQLLDDIVGNSSSVTKSNSEDQFSSTKRRRLGSSSVNSNQVQFAGLSSCFSGSMNVMQPVYNLDKTNSLVPKKEVIPKSQVGLWIDDSYSINAGGSVAAQPKRPVEPAKATKKRAKPGESTRPRPKDRQQIKDRLEELRGIIPNGSKCSIDVLLDRSIKHMLFLQSVTKYADKLKQVDEPKLIGHENGVVLKDNSSGGSGNSGGGATWAFEVSGQTMVCPIRVEDLNPPGQMLIEMLCEEQGFFLEIADIIRSFGLNILKGVMEVRENKIWARFIVEANRHVTRMDIFLSLVQLLQETATTGVSPTNQPSNVIDSGVPPFNNYQQPSGPLPISLAETLR